MSLVSKHAFSLISSNVRAASTILGSSQVSGAIGSIKQFHSPAYKRYLKRKPTSSEPISILRAKTLAASFQELDNKTLTIIGAMGDKDACEEILKRHIMAVDHVDYEDAEKVFAKIKKFNSSKVHLHSLPYRIGIFTGLTAATLSVPMVFDLNTVSWFNEHFVTADIPEPKDLETWLEVGSWSWNWMEPPLGQISFALLCLQYARAQMVNLGVSPFTQRMMRLRGESLAREFPRYDPKVLIDYSHAAKLTT